MNNHSPSLSATSPLQYQKVAPLEERNYYNHQPTALPSHKEHHAAHSKGECNNMCSTCNCGKMRYNSYVDPRYHHYPPLPPPPAHVVHHEYHHPATPHHSVIDEYHHSHHHYYHRYHNNLTNSPIPSQTSNSPSLNVVYYDESPSKKTSSPSSSVTTERRGTYSTSSSYPLPSHTINKSYKEKESRESYHMSMANEYRQTLPELENPQEMPKTLEQERANDSSSPSSSKKKIIAESCSSSSAQTPGVGGGGCTCKKSKCLKLYCQCFAQKTYCDSSICRCYSCLNTTQHEDIRQRSMKNILERNPGAFDNKIVLTAEEGVIDDNLKMSTALSNNENQQQEEQQQQQQQQQHHKLGCKCRKSACLKKYCECYQAQIYCSKNCRCIGCQNLPTNGSFHHRKDSNALPIVSTPQRRQQQQLKSSTQIVQHAESAFPMKSISTKIYSSDTKHNKISDKTADAVLSISNSNSQENADDTEAIQQLKNLKNQFKMKYDGVSSPMSNSSPTKQRQQPSFNNMNLLLEAAFAMSDFANHTSTSHTTTTVITPLKKNEYKKRKYSYYEDDEEQNNEQSSAPSSTLISSFCRQVTDSYSDEENLHDSKRIKNVLNTHHHQHRNPLHHAKRTSAVLIPNTVDTSSLSSYDQYLKEDSTDETYDDYYDEVEFHNNRTTTTTTTPASSILNNQRSTTSVSPLYMEN